MVNTLVGGKRFAHSRRLQDDRAISEILGISKGRLCGQDAFGRLISKLDREPAFLFKLKLTKNLKRAINRIPWPYWEGQPTLGLEQYAPDRGPTRWMDQA
jgi:hypothetical protein